MKFFHILYYLYAVFISFTGTEKIRYMITEHPAVTYFNPIYISYANISAQRYGRSNPFYYVALHFYSLYQLHNNVTVSFVFYEFLSNRYKRGFIEMHWKLCDLIHKDKFFGPALKQGKFDHPCPFPNGDYHFYNMTIPLTQIPRNFPFNKGRIYINVTGTFTNDIVAHGYLNMEIKETDIKNKPK